jgi:hypothetical protein
MLVCPAALASAQFEKVAASAGPATTTRVTAAEAAAADRDKRRFIETPNGGADGNRVRAR